MGAGTSGQAGEAAQAGASKVGGDMALFEWNDQYLLGLEPLDFEHMDLFRCINDLARLHARLAGHFALEEHTMREMNNPHYDAHKAEHDRFLEEVTEVVASFGTKPGDEHVEEFAIRVKEWILTHITTTDRQLVSRGR
jgi:hemerythrin-like metal-binding protein